MLMKTSMLSVLSDDVYEKKGDEGKVSGVRCQVAGIRCHVPGVGFMSQVRVMSQEPELLSRRRGQDRKVRQGAARGKRKIFAGKATISMKTNDDLTICPEKSGYFCITFGHFGISLGHLCLTETHFA